MAALDWVVLKIASRCNINCSYCYVYNRGNSNWRSQPAFFSLDLATQLGRQISEHCDRNAIRDFTIELHGGEPLLYERSSFRRLIQILRDESGENVSLNFCMQTNGLLIDDEWLEILNDTSVSFGISLDGPVATHQDQRVDFSGSGTTHRVARLVKKLRANPLFDLLNTGALCVVNPRLHGGETVKWFADLGFTGLGFLLPDGNFANPPSEWKGADAYCRFMDEAFDYWSTGGSRVIRVRNFANMIESFLGQRPLLDASGGDLRTLCTIETDGTIGVNDVLVLCDIEDNKRKPNIRTDKLGVHVEQYSLQSTFRSSDECQKCHCFQACGGGHIAHRFDGHTFENPSFHCQTLMHTVDIVKCWLQSIIPQERWVKHEVLQHPPQAAEEQSDSRRAASSATPHGKSDSAAW